MVLVKKWVRRGTGRKEVDLTEKWAGRVPRGKEVDLLVRLDHAHAAISTMRGIESELILRRRQLTNLSERFPIGSKPRARYLGQIKRLNQTLDKIGLFVR